MCGKLLLYWKSHTTLKPNGYYCYDWYQEIDKIKIRHTTKVVINLSSKLLLMLLLADVTSGPKDFVKIIDI